MTTKKPRLVTHISAHLDRRLRMAAAVKRTPIAVALEVALDKGLPTADELADQMRGGATDEQG